MATFSSAARLAAVAGLVALTTVPAHGQVAAKQHVVQYFSDAACTQIVGAYEDPQPYNCFETEDDTRWAGNLGIDCGSADVDVRAFNKPEGDDFEALSRSCDLLGNNDPPLEQFKVTYPVKTCVATDTTNDKLYLRGTHQKWWCGIEATALLIDQSLKNVYRQSCTSDACDSCGATPVEHEAADCKNGDNGSKRIACNWAETKVKVTQWSTADCEGAPQFEFQYNVGSCTAVDSNEMGLDFSHQKWTCGSSASGGSATGGSDGGATGGSDGGASGGSDGGSTTGGDSAVDTPSLLAAVLAAMGAALFVAAM